MDHSRIYHLTPKCFYHVRLHILMGITIDKWVGLIWRHRRIIAWSTYAFRLAFLSFFALLNTLLAGIELLLWGHQIAKTPLDDDIVFVLGAYRSGTTHLYNLLAQDPRFYAPDTIDCGMPLTCFLASPLKPFLWQEIRPMDNVRVTAESPQEDEYAINSLSGCHSPFASYHFMPIHTHYSRYFTLERCTPDERQKWTNAFVYFVRKMTYKAKSCGKRLLLKSPSHTARIKLLLQLFPKAKFVFIHRDPYAVFRSYLNMADTAYWQLTFCHMTDEQVVEHAVEVCDILWRVYLEQRRLIPAGQLYEMAFAHLDQDPVGELHKVYQALGWDSAWDAALPRLKIYANSVKDFPKNAIVATDAQRALVRQKFAYVFEAFGYDL